jgi:hypothetical protein
LTLIQTKPDFERIHLLKGYVGFLASNDFAEFTDSIGTESEWTKPPNEADYNKIFWDLYWSR